MFDTWPLPWQQCVSSFLQSIFDRSGSASSRRDYASNLKRFFLLCNKLPDQVTRADVLAFIQSSSTSKRNPGVQVSASTRNIRLCVLKMFYVFASEYTLEKDVPLYQQALPTQGLRYVKRAIAYRAMSAQELERFFSVIPTDTLKGVRDRALFLLYFLLGRRRGELYALRWRDIEAAIIVDTDGTRRESHVYRYYGKGHARQIRTKELPAYAWRVLCHYLEYAGRLQTMAPDDFLFCPIWRHRSGPLTYNYLNLLFRQYVRDAGLDLSRLSLHSLRHSGARERYNAGEDIISIKNLLDHSSLQTTFIYLQNLTGVADPGAKLLEARFGHLCTGVEYFVIIRYSKDFRFLAPVPAERLDRCPFLDMRRRCGRWCGRWCSACGCLCR